MGRREAASLCKQSKNKCRRGRWALEKYPPSDKDTREVCHSRQCRRGAYVNICKEATPSQPTDSNNEDSGKSGSQTNVGIIAFDYREEEGNGGKAEKGAGKGAYVGTL